MKIKVPITVESETGQPGMVQQVACLERGPLRPDTLGLSLAEARAILAGLEQPLVGTGANRRQKSNPSGAKVCVEPGGPAGMHGLRGHDAGYLETRSWLPAYRLSGSLTR